mmetsp:Transcript_4180/g.7085  ORF Transcript_4180/g.7085 Transcript_4180/m.7085 type:complete len:236 (-) Transcript_4180:9-716(-)
MDSGLRSLRSGGSKNEIRSMHTPNNAFQNRLIDRVNQPNSAILNNDFSDSSDMEDPISLDQNNGHDGSNQEEEEVDSYDSEEESEESEQQEGPSFEYEPESQRSDEERKNFDYDFSKEEFLNPVVVKGPDGTISLGTESKDKNSKEALCWNCNTHLIYRSGAKKVRCFHCKEVNDMEANNSEQMAIVQCQNAECQQDLVVPEDAYRVFCQSCNMVFVNKKHWGIYNKLDVLHFFS